MSRPAEPTFEEAVAQLEALVEQMESDQLPLADLLVRYEEGIKLVKVCSEKLTAAEKRIEIITRDAAGKPQAIPFDPAAPAGAPAPAPASNAQSANVSLF